MLMNSYFLGKKRVKPVLHLDENQPNVTNTWVFVQMPKPRLQPVCKWPQFPHIEPLVQKKKKWIAFLPNRKTAHGQNRFCLMFLYAVACFPSLSWFWLKWKAEEECMFTSGCITAWVLFFNEIFVFFGQGAWGEARCSLQHDAAVLFRSGCGLCWSKGNAYLALRRTHSRLVQGVYRPQELRATWRPR